MRVSLRRLRAGELLALGGGVGVAVSQFLPAYDSASGSLDGWDTIGAAVVVLLAAAALALALAVVTVTERSAAMPVAAAVLTAFAGLIAIVSAVVRLLERPDSATSTGSGGWLALAAAVAIFAGAWQALRDERTWMYAPPNPRPRPRP
jgi:predicted MFS family arabinose efflux permease